MSTQCQLSEPFEHSELSTWNPAQQSMLRALTDGASKSDAARVANVHRSTINNWEPKTEFRDAILAIPIRRIASRQYDAIRRNSVENVESLRNHFPVSRHLLLGPLSASEPTNTTKTQNAVENVECVESAGSIKTVESVECVETVGSGLVWDIEGMATGRPSTPGFWSDAASGCDVRVRRHSE